MWMNRNDIEILNRNQHACPNVRKGVRLLYRLMQAVDAQSDGWPYWKAPAEAADKLMDLIRTAGNIWYDTRGTITDAQLKAAITPIRRMVTVQDKKQKGFGNKGFKFDVDEALREPGQTRNDSLTKAQKTELLGFPFIVTVKHDNGQTPIGLRAADISEAVQKVMASEGCPERAIVNIERRE